jgi:hypothetical protein
MALSKAIIGFTSTLSYESVKGSIETEKQWTEFLANSATRYIEDNADDFSKGSGRTNTIPGASFNSDLCRCRVWNLGYPKQCSSKRVDDNRYCKMHQSKIDKSESDGQGGQWMLGNYDEELPDCHLAGDKKGQSLAWKAGIDTKKSGSGSKSNSKHPRPKGRSPKNKVWDGDIGEWVDRTVDPLESKKVSELKKLATDLGISVDMIDMIDDSPNRKDKLIEFINASAVPAEPVPAEPVPAEPSISEPVPAEKESTEVPRAKLSEEEEESTEVPRAKLSEEEEEEIGEILDEPGNDYSAIPLPHPDGILAKELIEKEVSVNKSIEKMNVKELREVARKHGYSDQKVEEARDNDNPKQALIDLINSSVVPADFEPEPEPDNKPEESTQEWTLDTEQCLLNYQGVEYLWDEQDNSLVDANRDYADVGKWCPETKAILFEDDEAKEVHESLRC